jgi:hypothetical protein
MAIYQVSILPDGTEHRALLTTGNGPGALRDAVEKLADHYATHCHPDGSVGIAPCPAGFVAQLHGPSGEIESWRMAVEGEKCITCGTRLQRFGCGTCYGRALEHDWTRPPKREKPMRWVHKRFVP